MKIYSSVKFRLTLWYTAVLILFLSVFSSLMQSELKRTLYRDADRLLSSEAERIADSLQDFLMRDVPSLKLSPQFWRAGTQMPLEAGQREKIIDMFLAWERATSDYLARNPLFIRMVGMDNTLFVSNLKGWQKDIIFPSLERDSDFMEAGYSYQTIHFRSRPIRLFYWTVFYEGQPVFVLQMGTSLHEIRGVLSRLSFLLSILIPVAAVLACLPGWFLAKRSFKPVEDMIRQSQQITTANLTSRLKRSGAGDELDKLAETLNQMIDRIESSTRAVKEFSSDVSHELKTPLAIVKGEIDLALRRPRSQEELLKTLSSIGSEIDDLITLVEDLMILVRTDAAQLKIVKVSVSLRDLVLSCIDRFKQRASAKKVDLNAGDLAAVWTLGDESYLKRMVGNLIDNAIKFTPSGGRVVVDVVSDGGYAMIHVTDTGIGISPEIQEKIFGRFFRSEEARSYEGAGLGLNIVKALCSLHGASVTLESKIGYGTKISLRFPAPPPNH